MNGYCLFLVISQSFAKVATNEGVNVFDLVFMRTLCNWAIAMGTNAILCQNPFSFKCEHIGPLITRSFTGLICYSCILFGCKLLPIFLANIMLNTGPFWAALLAYCVLGENLSLIDIICMVGCFIGVVVLATSPAPKQGHDLLLKSANHSLKPHVNNVIVPNHMAKTINHSTHLNATKTPFLETTKGKYIFGVVAMLTAAWT